MAYINENYFKLKAGYLFPEIGRRVKEFAAANPGKDIIRMGIGDVTQPLPPSIIKAFHEGVEEMGNKSTFKGYGPEQGYDFLPFSSLGEKLFGRHAGDVCSQR